MKNANPDFYYKKKQNGALSEKTYSLNDKQLGDLSFHSVINLMIESPNPGLTQYVKMIGEKTQLLIKNKSQLEEKIYNFICEKSKLYQENSTNLDTTRFPEYPLSFAYKSYFSGSALTSFILNFLKNDSSSIQYKDLDLYFFLPSDFDTSNEFFQKKLESTYIKNQHFNIFPFMEEDLNILLVQGQHPNAAHTPEDVFEDFDLSCNHVYFDLTTKTLHWTPFFVEFLELSLIRINPGWHTFSVRSMIRAKKKGEEFKSKVAWDEAEIPLLRQYLFNQDFIFSHGDYLSKEQELWLQGNQLPYLDFDTSVMGKPQAVFNEQYQHLSLLQKNLAAFKTVTGIYSFYGARNTRSSTTNATQILLSHLAELSKQHKLGSGTLPQNYLLKLQQLSSCIPDFLWTPELISNFESQNNFHPVSFDKTFPVFWRPHAGFLIEVFKRLKYDLAALRDWGNSVIKYGTATPAQQLKWVGFVEKSPGLKYQIQELPALWAEFVEFSTQTKKQIINPLKIKQWSHQVTELYSQEELDLEGQSMHHCVAGYSSALKRGDSRIFHLTTLSGASTLEVNPRDWSIRQHRSFCNREVHPANKKMARRFLKFLKSQGNQIILKSS